MNKYEKIAEQSRRQQLPAGWGDSLTQKPGPRPPDYSGLRTEGADPSDRLLGLLHEMAHVGEALPSLAELGRRLNLPIDKAHQRIARCLHTLVSQGKILMWTGDPHTPQHLQRKIFLLSTGQELQTKNIPDEERLG